MQGRTGPDPVCSFFYPSALGDIHFLCPSPQGPYACVPEGRGRSVSDAWLEGEGFEPPVSSRSTDNQALFGLCAALYDLERSPGSRQGSLWSLLASSSSILISAFYKECLSRLRRPYITKDPDDSKSSPNFSFPVHGHQCLYWSTDPLQKSKGRSANF